MKKLIYPLFIVLASCLWGIISIFVRWLNSLGFSTYEVVFLRLFIATLCITLAFLIFNRKAFKIKLKDLWCFIGTGTVSVLGTSFFYFSTIDSASVSTACVFMYTSPIFIIVISRILFKEKITFFKMISLVVIMLGCTMCSYSKGGFTINLISVITGLLSGLSYGLYGIFSRYAINRGYKIDTILLYTFIFSLVGALFIVPYPSLISNIKNDVTFILPSIGVGVISGVLPYAFYTLGLKGVSNSKAGIIACLEIVVSLLTGIIVFNEIPLVYNIVGIVLVLIAVSLQQVDFSKLSKKDKN